jgi:plastocyanin
LEGWVVVISRLAVVAAASLILLLGVGGTVSASNLERHVNMLDDCDATTFNATIGPGTCAKAGGTTFEKFIGQLMTKGQAPAWRFASTKIKLPAGGSIGAYNRGGEFHTFTHVANFGGGCVPQLNAVLGLTPVPECADPNAFATGAGPGGEVDTPALSPGVYRFQCLVHPWMRATVTVG